MKSITESITLTISRAEGLSIVNELRKEYTSMRLHTDMKGTPIAVLHRVLSVNFESARMADSFMTPNEVRKAEGLTPALPGELE